MLWDFFYSPAFDAPLGAAHHPGNVWLPIISLRREDASRLGYESAEQWRTFLSSYAAEIAEAMKAKDPRIAQAYDLWVFSVCGQKRRPCSPCPAGKRALIAPAGRHGVEI